MVSNRIEIHSNRIRFVRRIAQLYCCWPRRVCCIGLCSQPDIVWWIALRPSSYADFRFLVGNPLFAGHL